MDEKSVAASVVYNQLGIYLGRMGREEVTTDGKSGELGSSERCYQHDEGARRSLRIIGSYDCLSRAPAIRDCERSRGLHVSADDRVFRDDDDGIASGGQACAAETLLPPSFSPWDGISHYNKNNKQALSASGVA